MKKQVIAVMLSMMMVVGSVGAVPVFAAEEGATAEVDTEAEEAVAEQKEAAPEQEQTAEETEQDDDSEDVADEANDENIQEAYFAEEQIVDEPVVEERMA